MSDPNPSARTMFLHVFEIGDEQDWVPADVKFVPPAGVQIGSRWRVQFEATGSLGGKIGDRRFRTTVETERQYSAQLR